jgi:hypothetical protein
MNTISTISYQIDREMKSNRAIEAEKEKRQRVETE